MSTVSRSTSVSRIQIGYCSACRPFLPNKICLTSDDRAYFHSASTLNCVRSLLGSGFADLHNPRSWSLSHVRNPELAASFESIVERLEDSLDFLKVIGSESGSLSSVDLYTSHEVRSVSLAGLIRH